MITLQTLPIFLCSHLVTLETQKLAAHLNGRRKCWFVLLMKEDEHSMQEMLRVINRSPLWFVNVSHFRLEWLNASWNQLRSLPTISGFHLPLRWLLLSHNALLDDSWTYIICCPRLKVLKLSFNKFETVPKEYVESSAALEITHMIALFHYSLILIATRQMSDGLE